MQGASLGFYTVQEQFYARKQRPMLLSQNISQAFDPMSSHDVNTVLGNARSLQRAARAGATQPLLRGKNFGLLCETNDDRDAALFRQAAVELGAHVANIRLSASKLATPQEVKHTARLLGRLYDAVECQGMSPEVVQQLGNDAGVPVYDGIASNSHPTACLAGLLGEETSPPDNRRFVLQAVLLSTLA
jgi:ornithine carbamoyltransferase